jgi:hypothetical protein
MIVVKRALCGALDALGIGPNHALQPTAGRCKTSSQHVYEVRPRSDKRGFDLISDALPFVGCGTASRTQSAMQSEAGKAFWKIKPPPIKTAKSKIVPCAA